VDIKTMLVAQVAPQEMELDGNGNVVEKKVEAK
jgi:hypothetical protein